MWSGLPVSLIRRSGPPRLRTGFSSPPDLRSLYQYAFPVGPKFPAWRNPASEFIRGILAWPAGSICFDVEHDAFWLDGIWETRPSDLEEAKEYARARVREAPFLIPIFGHRFLPATPSEAGNPVFSVYQTDVIIYGMDLPSYLHAEFSVPNPFPAPEYPSKEISFWSELERRNG